MNNETVPTRRGVVSYGVHLPRHLLNRKEISRTLGQGGGSGTRTVAGYDEDTNSMGVEAARAARWRADWKVGSVSFATTAPAYADKTNATTVHAALGLESAIFAGDHIGSARGGFSALRTALADSGLAVLSDIRIGRPGSSDEARTGDGAAAFLFGSGESVIAEVVAQASESVEFLDRWRTPGEWASSVWEERFGQDIYMASMAKVVKRVLKAAGIDKPDHVVISSLHARVAKMAAAGFGPAAADPIDPVAGQLGTAHLGVRLAEILDRAKAGETILLASAFDGADAMILKVTDAIAGRKPANVMAQIEAASPLAYATFLTWRGVLDREPPRRPDPVRYDAPPAFRVAPWKFAFQGTRCKQCSRAHLPPQRVCGGCGAIDEMIPAAFADTPGTIVTFSIDHLAYSLAPPVISAVIDYDGGGRYGCELTDCTADQVRVGLRVEMTFRKMFSAGGVHNYFWKAKPHGK